MDGGTLLEASRGEDRSNTLLGKKKTRGLPKKRKVKGKVRFPEVRSLKETGNNQRSEGVAGPLPGVSQVADRGRPFKYDRYREIIPGADQN